MSRAAIISRKLRVSWEHGVKEAGGDMRRSRKTETSQVTKNDSTSE